MLHHLFTANSPTVVTTAKRQKDFISCAGFLFAINKFKIASLETQTPLTETTAKNQVLS